MARRVDHSHEELGEMILSAACELVEAGGSSALTARKVANTIGYSPGTIYNIFNNLDDLILRLNGRTLERLYLHLPRPDPDKSVENNFDGLLRGYLEFVEQNRNLWRILFDHRPSTEEELPEWYNDKVSKLLGLIDRVIEPHAPDIHQNELREISAALWAGVHGIISLADSRKLEVVSTAAPLDLCRLLVRSFLSGLTNTVKS
ncbi:TetR/AcrR family transcriptional regulator [Kiloniella sp.]|uniref:TetR/AcrR family transcriptional regulator n=1 Tax=Kiloniella sp. TaxID=1938587 RepID=UPI003B016444